VFEKVAVPLPVGAGIMLQPSGQRVLRDLGLLDVVLARAAPCAQLRVVQPSGAELLLLKYHDVDARYRGYGIHRGILFEALLGAVRAELELVLGADVQEIMRAGERRFLRTDAGHEYGPFDLVVVADGARSRLRGVAQVSRQDGYPWGALWFMAEDRDGVFDGELYQVVSGTSQLIGLLPTGRDPAGRKCVSLFVSVRADRTQAFLAQPLDTIRTKIVALAPRAETVVKQLTAPSDLLFSGYMDVVMPRWHGRREVYLGDAAHATSPQLGQGANLALYDAHALAAALDAEADVPRALERYTRARKAHLAYYQFITRALTPFFQSDYEALGTLRDWTFPIVRRVPLLRNAMTLGMCGVSDGHPFARLRDV
jgi:2-polyprenyl-6-methoxyphenol hydroxylase-like FAD-dependent oxidoreductase